MTVFASSVSALARVGCSATAAYTRGSQSAASVTQRAESRSSAMVTTAWHADGRGAVHDRPHVVAILGAARVEVGVRVDQWAQRLGRRRRRTGTAHRHTIR